MYFSKNKFFFILLATIVIGIWGITFVCTKALLVAFSSLEILFIRYLIAYIALWIIFPHKLNLKKKKEELYFVFAGLTGVTIYQFMENIAIHYTNASNVSIIVSICPMFTAIFSQMFFHEKVVTKKFVLGFIISIIGVVLVSFNGVVKFHLNLLGDFLALGAGISWGFYSLFVSKINLMAYNPIASTRRIFFYAIIFMIPLVLFGAYFSSLDGSSFFVNLAKMQNKERFMNSMNWINLLFLGLIASSFCFIAWNKVCSELGTVNATVGIYMIPVVTVIFAFIFLGESLSVMGIVGTACTLGGVIISNLK